MCCICNNCIHNEVCEYCVYDINFTKCSDFIDKSHGKCKTCKNYRPYIDIGNVLRKDGYCKISRMSAEGIVLINCNEDFGCLDYQKGD